MVRSPACDGSSLKEAAQRLKVAKTIIAKVSNQGSRVQIQPGGLNVHHDAELGDLLDRLNTHEVGMRDARTVLSHWPGSVEFFIDLKQRVDCPVTDGVSRELQSALQRGLDNRQQPFVRNE